tara:strand:+ start:856 stop:1092 length:237 start_codon:yes stop_codon:yes gene_type:complete
MRCEKCGSLSHEVKETRRRTGDPNPINKNKSNTPYTYRRRVCSSCGHKFATREYTIPDLIAFGKQGYSQMIDDLMKTL